MSERSAAWSDGVTVAAGAGLAGYHASPAALRLTYCIKRFEDVFLSEGNCLATGARGGLKLLHVEKFDTSPMSDDEAATLERGRGDRNGRSLDAEDVSKFFLRQRQSRSLVAAGRRVKQNTAHAALDQVKCGTCDELARFHKQRFDMLVDGGAQVRGLNEKLSIAGSANAPSLPSDLYKRPCVAQSAAAGFECTESSIAPYHATADALTLDALGGKADKCVVRKPDPLHFGAGFLQNLFSTELYQLKVSHVSQCKRRLDLGEDLIFWVKRHVVFSIGPESAQLPR